MKTRTTCTAVAAIAAALSLALTTAPPVHAGEPAPHRLGDHPAVVVQRLHQTAGYDYASKFYPHPAWLYLNAGPAADANDDRALIARGGTAAEPDAGTRTGTGDQPFRTAWARR